MEEHEFHLDGGMDPKWMEAWVPVGWRGMSFTWMETWVPNGWKHGSQMDGGLVPWKYGSQLDGGA